MTPSFSGLLVTCAYLPVHNASKTSEPLTAAIQARNQTGAEHAPQTILPVFVTRPSSLTLTCPDKPHYVRVGIALQSPNLVHLGKALTKSHTSITVPLVITPRDVYTADWGFFLTPRIFSWGDSPLCAL
jgi:hypothetical protein